MTCTSDLWNVTCKLSPAENFRVVHDKIANISSENYFRKSHFIFGENCGSQFTSRIIRSTPIHKRLTSAVRECSLKLIRLAEKTIYIKRSISLRNVKNMCKFAYLFDVAGKSIFRNPCLQKDRGHGDENALRAGFRDFLLSMLQRKGNRASINLAVKTVNH